MRKRFDALLRSESGATAVEYALLAMCIALAILTAVTTLGVNLNTAYTEISSAFN